MDLCGGIEADRLTADSQIRRSGFEKKQSRQYEQSETGSAIQGTLSYGKCCKQTSEWLYRSWLDYTNATPYRCNEWTGFSSISRAQSETRILATWWMEDQGGIWSYVAHGKGRNYAKIYRRSKKYWQRDETKRCGRNTERECWLLLPRPLGRKSSPSSAALADVDWRSEPQRTGQSRTLLVQSNTRGVYLVDEDEY